MTDKKPTRLLWFALLALLGAVATHRWPMVSFGFSVLTCLLAGMHLALLSDRRKR
ncbi:MAG: hypothetical protein ACJ72N_27560 [Labedaea sp.]